MKHRQKNVTLTLYAAYVAIAAVIAVSFALSRILDISSIHRMLLPVERKAIVGGFYCSLPMILLALWKVLRLLKNIQIGQVFVAANVKALAVIRSCCLGIFAVCLAAGCFFYPLFLVVAIMGFLGLMMQVLKQVMAQAVAIREENDLTV